MHTIFGRAARDEREGQKIRLFVFCVHKILTHKRRQAYTHTSSVEGRELLKLVV